MIKAGIIGAAGYTGGELIRILLRHPKVQIIFTHSTTFPGKPVASVHTDLQGETDLKFTDKVPQNINMLFLCLGSGESRKFLEGNSIDKEVRIIDLSNDFRLQGKNSFGVRQFVYGLVEMNQEQIRNAQNIANPGCFATAIELALLPLANEKLLNDDIHISAITGSTGAGKSLQETTHFTWRANNVAVYKPFTHQHLSEIGETICQLQPDFKSVVNFIPYRGSFTRGIFASVYTKCTIGLEELKPLYENYYMDFPLTRMSPEPIHLKQVVNTNKCLLHLEVHNNKALITSVIDNLLKGASGQAVQNMNLMFGLPVDTGLTLKSVYF